MKFLVSIYNNNILTAFQNYFEVEEFRYILACCRYIVINSKYVNLLKR